MIRRELRLQLVQKPQPRLGKRGRIGLAAWGPITGQGGGGENGRRQLGNASAANQQGAQARNGGVLKQGRQGRRTAQALLDA